MSMQLACFRNKLDPDETTDKIFELYSAEIATTGQNHILTRKSVLGKLSRAPVIKAKDAVKPTPSPHLSPQQRIQLENDHDQWHEGQGEFHEQCSLCQLQREIDAITRKESRSRRTRIG